MSKNTVAKRTSFFQDRFLKKFSEGRFLGEAAKAAGIKRSTVYIWLKNDAFKSLFEEARLDALEVTDGRAI
jgi:hypothetical protein